MHQNQSSDARGRPLPFHWQKCRHYPVCLKPSLCFAYLEKGCLWLFNHFASLRVCARVCACVCACACACVRARKHAPERTDLLLQSHTIDESSSSKTDPLILEIDGEKIELLPIALSNSSPNSVVYEVLMISSNLSCLAWSSVAHLSSRVDASCTFGYHNIGWSSVRCLSWIGLSTDLSLPQKTRGTLVIACKAQYSSGLSYVMLPAFFRTPVLIPPPPPPFSTHQGFNHTSKTFVALKEIDLKKKDGSAVTDAKFKTLTSELGVFKHLKGKPDVIQMITHKVCTDTVHYLFRHQLSLFSVTCHWGICNLQETFSVTLHTKKRLNVLVWKSAATMHKPKCLRTSNFPT